MERDIDQVTYGQRPRWEPEAPRFRPTRVLLAWGVSALSVLIGAGLVPGVELHFPGGALLTAAAIGILNAILPPVLAALRLPLTLVLGFLLVLVADALLLMAASKIVPDSIVVNSFGDALLATLVIAAASIVLQVVLGTNDDSEYQMRVTRRIARRQGPVTHTDAPGIVFLEIDGLAMPILRRAMQSGSAPAMARWMAEDGYRLDEWETDLSSQTGASQAGILLGSNEGIPAFRWVEKERGVLMSCSSPPDCAEIEKRLSTGAGLLSGGGASRGNLLSGDAEAVILTVSRMDEEKRANPGYRAFLANGFNVTRALVLFIWEMALEVLAARRAVRRDVRPRGHRGGIYPLLRGFMCVVVRDLVVYGVLTDMMRGRPVIYATFASYDEVAHHSGLERADTLEALRKLDQQFDRIFRSRRFAARPYEIVVLSDHGQTQGATFKQRNGYGLDELVAKSLESGKMLALAEGDEQQAMASRAVVEATGRGKEKRPANDVSDRDVVVLGSGNLGLVYLMESSSRMSMEEIDERHPELLPALRSHPHVGWVLVRSSAHGAMVLGARGSHRLADGVVEGEDPLANFSPTAARHLLRTDGFTHCADMMVGSFYDPETDEGCAFEELISFHGGLGGPQTRPFVLHPPALQMPSERVLGAGSLHQVLMGWRGELSGTPLLGAASEPPPAVPAA
ncbi:phage holin family protein [Solirubrobacter soli]|uniref:phage holin family protein n=1 Tax=Solirubrobacter soli TaxID=363832 RepID=UPI00041AC700|nr:phage holin family protein [Solirubrobacter soli]